MPFDAELAAGMNVRSWRRLRGNRRRKRGTTVFRRFGAREFCERGEALAEVGIKPFMRMPAPGDSTSVPDSVAEVAILPSSRVRCSFSIAD